MPRQAKGPRLYLVTRKGRAPVYVIRDTGKPDRTTGTGERSEAETALAEYIQTKIRRSGPASAEEMTVVDALNIYLTEHAPTTKAKGRIGYAVSALVPFWDTLPIIAVKGATCRRYAATRRSAGMGDGTIRYELLILNAALNYCAREGYLLHAPKVTLPPRPETRQRALTRGEVAYLLRQARRMGHRHLAHFILISIYTGTRKEAVLSLRLEGPSAVGGWFDLDEGLLYRRGAKEKDSSKRRVPARIPRQLLAHARRWHAMGDRWAVQYRGGRVGSIQRSWSLIVEGMDWKPTPHSLKHTAITEAVKGGATLTECAAFFGTTTEVIEKTYWHLSPQAQAGAVTAMERKA